MNWLRRIVSNSHVGDEAAAIKEAINRSQAVIEFDVSGNILCANARFLNAMGYDLSEILGKHHRIFVDAAYSQTDAYKNFWNELRAGVTKEGEFLRKGKNSKDVYIEAAYNPVFDKSGNVLKIIKFAYDVTERKRKDIDAAGKLAALDRSQAVIEFDLAGNVLTANDNFLHLLGYELNEIVGLHHSLFVDDKDKRSIAYSEFWRDLREGKFVSDRFKRIGKGGREIIIRATYNPILGLDGRPVKIVKFASDVTEQALLDADRLGQMDAISRAQAVIEFDLEGNVLKANPNFLKVMGYQLDEIVGKHHRIFVDDITSQSDDYKHFWNLLKAGEYVSAEFRRLTKNHEPVYIQASYNAIMDEDGRPYKIVKYASDVTKRREALNRTTELSHSLQDLSAAVEEMAVTGRSIAETMSNTKEAADKATLSVTEADQNAQNLETVTKHMDGIVEFITNITSQINLLALNATIESARAGDAGRGFAVVATEVKNLANQAKTATDQIATQIADVRSSSTAVVTALAAIRSTVEDVQEHILYTAGAVEEQSAASQDMARNMQIASTEAENIVRVA